MMFIFIMTKNLGKGQIGAYLNSRKLLMEKMFNILEQIFTRVNVFSVEKKENLLCCQQKGLELRRVENCIQAKDVWDTGLH